jgi:hypothetical protein
MFPQALPIARLLLLAAVLFLAGCASGGGQKSVPASAPVPLPAGVTLSKHPHLNAVWLADGFRFTGYDVVVVPPPEFRAVERPNEVNERATALRNLHDTVIKSLRESGAFSQVVSSGETTPVGSRVATLRLWVVEYEKGGGGARYFAGIYGAGQPVIKVRGDLMDSTGGPLFVFEARRSGESGSARVFGAYRADDSIQSEDLRDLGVDLRDFIVQQRAGEK